MTIKVVIKFFRPVIINMMYTWWYISRPTTSGSLVVIRCGDEILLVTTTYGHGYGLPGGGIKRGETPLMAAKREVFEEVGVDAKKLHALPSFTIPDKYKKDTVYSFYTEVTSKDFVIDNLEIDTAVWHPINNLPKLNAPTEKIIDLYLKELDAANLV